MLRRNFFGSFAALIGGMAAGIPLAKQVKSIRIKNCFNKLKYIEEGSIHKCFYSDIYISPEAYEDIKNWGCDSLDDDTKMEILKNGFGSI